MVERFQQIHPYKHVLNYVYHLRNVSYLLENDHTVSNIDPLYVIVSCNANR